MWRHWPKLSLYTHLLWTPCNLISTRKLTHALPYSVTRKTIRAGHESRNLYYLPAPTPPIACSAIESPPVVHQHLGHPSLEKSHLMVPSLSKVSTLKCESYQFGKHTRNSFCDRVNNRLLTLVVLFHSNELLSELKPLFVVNCVELITFVSSFDLWLEY